MLPGFGVINVHTCAAYRSVILTSGGIGITPMLSVLSHLLDQSPSQRPPYVCFVWCVREVALIRCFEKELLEAVEVGWDVRVHLTGGNGCGITTNDTGTRQDQVERGNVDNGNDEELPWTGLGKVPATFLHVCTSFSVHVPFSRCTEFSLAVHRRKGRARVARFWEL